MPGGWAGSNRKADLPPDWEQRRAKVKDRAGGRCERIKTSTGKRCANAGTDCDHKVRPADGGTDELDNLEWLCGWHHRAKTSVEGNDARRAALARTRRPQPKHPGLR